MSIKNSFFSFLKNPPAETSAVPPPPAPAASATTEAPEVAALRQQLANAQTEAMSLRAQIEAANKAVTDTTNNANAALALCAGERDKALQETASLRVQVATLNGQLSAANQELEGLRAQTNRSREEVKQEVRNTELAALAASQGIPANSPAIAPVNPGDGSGSGKTAAQSLQDRIAASGDPMERAKLRAQLWQTLRAG